MVHGIDLSHWNNIKDWSDLANSVDFVLLKAGEGSREDITFADRYAICKQRAIPCGAYYFVPAGAAKNCRSATRHAENFLKFLGGKTFEMPIYIDFEVADKKNNKNANTDFLINMLTVLEHAGAFAGIYSYDSAFNDLMDYSRLAGRYTLWIARYGREPKHDQWDIWQKTSKKQFTFTVDDVDYNVSKRDFPAIIKKAGKNIF